LQDDWQAAFILQLYGKQGENSFRAATAKGPAPLHFVRQKSDSGMQPAQPPCGAGQKGWNNYPHTGTNNGCRAAKNGGYRCATGETVQNRKAKKEKSVKPTI